MTQYLNNHPETKGVRPITVTGLIKPDHAIAVRQPALWRDSGNHAQAARRRRNKEAYASGTDEPTRNEHKAATAIQPTAATKAGVP